MASTMPTTGLAGTSVPVRINNRSSRDFRPCRDDPDDDHRRVQLPQPTSLSSTKLGCGGVPQKETKKKWIAKSKKRVSFASPLAQVFGPSKEDYIREMLNAPGWEPVASPMADDDLGEARCEN
ncbi:hypothetical protein SETIT_6G152100v2 [Setaria italica]|uniref:Uncharacterized protein n=1 Tax=Setaria italica TaxID=4555 RepID=A0A368RNF1_SETIT|nr:hypothetical protein SETIT_6G152100v2 [Setaria italica]